MASYLPRGAVQKVSADVAVQRLLLNAHTGSFGQNLRIVNVGTQLLQMAWSADAATVNTLAVDVNTALPIRGGSEFFITLPNDTKVLAFIASGPSTVFIQAGDQIE